MLIIRPATYMIFLRCTHIFYSPSSLLNPTPMGEALLKDNASLVGNKEILNAIQ